MASININVPDATAGRVVHALCLYAGLEETPANAKKAVLIWIKRTVSDLELFEAERAQPPIADPVVDTIVS